MKLVGWKEFNWEMRDQFGPLWIRFWLKCILGSVGILIMISILFSWKIGIISGIAFTPFSITVFYLVDLYIMNT